MIKIFTVIGARPQFIKASVVSKAIQQASSIKETILHTGQHFDKNMSDIFFNQLGIPKPSIKLNVNGGNHGQMTGRMLIEIEEALLHEKPDRVLVYGDTNSTLAGALAAAKLNIPVAHVEAGLRSFNNQMPEEINRILTDRLSDVLFCPTELAVKNLRDEGIDKTSKKVFKSGDVMQDAALFFSRELDSEISNSGDGNFVLATLHRAENTDNPKRLASLVRGLNRVHKHVSPVVLPLHPRTKKLIQKQGLSLDVDIIDPVGYFEMLNLLRRCQLVLTDSGGVQKEAFFFNKACVTMRDQTEWVELIDIGANELVGADEELLFLAAKSSLGRYVEDDDNLYGGGTAAKRIVRQLLD
ncbi:UDP-N-acetylglucosamine 2-epimerase (non-hydrolyzing) [Idiomarina tyrosinivorans]|uniref:UDP-N-acetylglucosamine 2-epimerase (Non-hydrolyzing) n=1 Tax=Idiomarina tyrosinivorans TaxID=1445662 RepID=A0A432ZR04_9GAMM|nr:UDP-N-acetylglucosamine 2-epimerase (non-hydrolyzing) [Idiomarina tyrosinivorans]RUO80261.1 UDP-N-acetylglucosamine 2-epimerase (non-hydrolyzing) [Idiomarina tyrosinivorans]